MEVDIKREETTEYLFKEYSEPQIPSLPQLCGRQSCLFSPQQKSEVLFSGEVSKLGTHPHAGPNPNPRYEKKRKENLVYMCNGILLRKSCHLQQKWS